MIRATLLSLVLASTALAAPPKIEVQTLPPAGTTAAEAVVMNNLALHLARGLSSDVTAVPVSKDLESKSVACADDAEYQRCLQTGTTLWKAQSVAPAADTGVDAVAVYIFNKSDNGYSGAVYLVPRGGKWISTAFSAKRAGERLKIFNPLVQIAPKATGLKATDTPVRGEIDYSAVASPGS